MRDDHWHCHQAESTGKLWPTLNCCSMTISVEASPNGEPEQISGNLSRPSRRAAARYSPQLKKRHGALRRAGAGLVLLVIVSPGSLSGLERIDSWKAWCSALFEVEDETGWGGCDKHGYWRLKLWICALTQSSSRPGTQGPEIST